MVIFTYSAASFGAMLVPNLKNYGASHITRDDAYLSLVGGLGAFANGIMRPFWGALKDGTSYRTAALINLTCQLICLITIQMFENKIVYGF